MTSTGEHPARPTESSADRRARLRTEIAIEQYKHPLGSRVDAGVGTRPGVVVKHLPTGFTLVRLDGRVTPLAARTASLRQLTAECGGSRA